MTPAELWTAWGADPAATGVAVAVLAVLVAGYRRMRAGTDHGVVGPRHVALGAAGWLALAVATVSPLEPLGGALFSAHMGQHLLLTLVAPPLLLLGRAHVAVVRLVPLPARRRLLRSTARLGRDVGVAGAVVLAGLHVAVVLAWHVPVLYDLAVGTPAVHGLEHATLLGSALGFWAALGAGRREPVAAAALLSFVTALSLGALAALLSFAPEPWYASHLGSTRVWGLTPLADQQLAGALMWIPGGIVYLAAAAVGVVRWIGADERRQAPHVVGRSAPG